MAERLLWERLRNQRNGLVFRRQQVLGAFIADFYCAKAKLVIELDGWTHERKVEKDETRDGWLKSEGYAVVRIWNMAVIRGADATATALFILAEQLSQEVRFGYKHEPDSPSPSLSPGGERGSPATNDASASRSTDFESKVDRDGEAPSPFLSPGGRGDHL